MYINLSASSIKDYISCNKKYYYRRFFSSKAEPNIYMEIGTIVHNAIEKYWNDETLAMAYANEESKNIGIDSRKITNSLNSYFRYFRDFVSPSDELEKFFKLPYTDTHYDNVYILGKFDLVSRKNSVFDWKTSQKPPKVIYDDVQFILYDWAFKKVYGYAPANVYYASLTTGKLIKYRENKAYTDVLFNEVIPSMLDAINNDDYPRTGMLNYFKQCHNCSFRSLCWDELASRDTLER